MHADVTRSFSEQEALVSRGALAHGTLAGEYEITSLIARGGCGSVYRARHPHDGREAAVKVLHESLAAQPKMVERFAREVQLLNLLKHPNIVEVYDIGTLPDGRPYYTMVHLTGRTLASILHERGRLPPDEVLAVLDPVCAALGAAHAASVIHRDVKASNIMIEDGGPPHVKLVDFGIAKLLAPPPETGGLTSEGRQVGTITIMAPEQLLGAPIDARTDIYALGVLLYRLLTGRHPFDGQSPVVLAQQHLEEPAPRPSDRIPLPLALDAVVLCCLEKRPERRFPTVGDFVDALREVVVGAHRQAGSGAYTPAHGVAVYLEIRLDADADEVDEAMSDDVGSILDLSEEMLLDHHFVLALETGTQLLGVRFLPTTPILARVDRLAALEIAAELRQAIDQRRAPDRRVHVNVCVHAGEIVVRTTGRPEVIGGTLARVDRWAPREHVAELCATREALDGLPDLRLALGPTGLFRIGLRSSTGEGEGEAA